MRYTPMLFLLTLGLAGCGQKLSGAKQIDAGSFYTCVLRDSGAVACVGSNSTGELGNGAGGPGKKSSSVVSVSGLSDVVQLSAGDSAACAVKKNGRLACWGSVPSTKDEASSPPYALAPKEITELSGVVDVAVADHICAVLASGEVQCWGRNNYRQCGHTDDGPNAVNETPLGPVSGLSDATSVVVGVSHSCALRKTGEVVCWGSNKKGQLGDGTNQEKSQDPVLVKGLSKVTQISAGPFHTCAVHESGEVSCWGEGEFGNLGNGATQNANVPVRVSGVQDAIQVSGGGFHSCAVRKIGEVLCWGKGESGKLGDGTEHDRLAPVPVQSISDAVQVSAGMMHTCALRKGGEVLCWGQNDANQIGSAPEKTLLPTAQ